MEKFYGNYLGLCINNADPEYRGRVQVFIPHIMPALYERWNQEGVDKKIEIVGNNLEDALSQEDIEQLKQMLPWAEAAAPVFGNSAAGHYNPQSGNFNQLHGTEAEAAASAGSGGNTSGSLVDFVKGFEGFSATPYEDYGQTSIGYGTRAQPGEASITETEAAARLQQELNEAAGYVNSALAERNITLNQRQIEALTSYTYNRGPGGLRELLNNSGNTWSSIGPNMVQYWGSNQSVKKGLIRRRNAELLYSNTTPPDLNEPASGLYPGSANSAQYNPHISIESQVHLSLNPSDQAIQTTPGTSSSTSGAPVEGGSQNPFNFRDATKGAGALIKTKPNGKKVTYCLRGTINIAGHLTGNSKWNGSSGIRSANMVDKVGNLLTAPATSGPGKGKILYNNEGAIQGTTYQPQQGDVMIHRTGLGGLGKIHGHAQIFVNGAWHSFKTEGNTLGSYLNLSGQQSTLFRLTPDGQQAMLALGRADTSQLGVPYEGTAPITTEPTADTEDNTQEFEGAMTRNPTSSQTTVLDTTGMPQGLFSVPNPGAMLWVFFREGDPLYPVYFAASYGAREWQNAFKAGSPGGHYPTAQDTTPRNQAIFRPNQSGGISFVDTITEEEDARSLRIFHANGGHMEWHLHGSVLYSPNEHVQQVAGNAYNSCLNREDWTQGDNNNVTIGNQYIIVGNASAEALDIIEEHAQIVKDINKNMLKGG